MRKLLIVPALSAMIIAMLSSSFAAETENFTDVASGSWYYDAVDYVVKNDLFNGTGENIFSPGETMTRGMFVTVLGRFANAALYRSGIITGSVVNVRSGPSVSDSIVEVLTANTMVDITGFSGVWYKISRGDISGWVRGDLMSVSGSNFIDVDDSLYYGPYVAWAYINNIANGYSGAFFSPDRGVTREEICSMLYNYADHARLDISPQYEKADFADLEYISPEYIEAVYAMQQLGVVNGRGDDTFAPDSPATRAEVAVMFMRFAENAKYKFGIPVRERAAVPESYFNDACFIGHSIVVGMDEHFKLRNSDFYAVNGIAAGRILTYDSFKLPSGKTGTLKEALGQAEYGKVYIMLGTNELGKEENHRSEYYNNMCELTDLVREALPEAKLYLLAVPPVSREKSGSGSQFNRENVIAFNAQLLRVAEEKKAYYIDIYSLLADGNGHLPADACFPDGIHLIPGQYSVILDYLKSRTV
ncbi:MAG: S-layer homology domain-containing protein [Oscillospiraceae bacterium]|nr:S-layer homology domain-containing protein [Oscillospiraceae bacterium]